MGKSPSTKHKYIREKKNRTTTENQVFNGNKHFEVNERNHGAKTNIRKNTQDTKIQPIVQFNFGILIKRNCRKICMCFNW